MSFKRDGDDKAWLSVLNKRRVSELFALEIPDDEAFLVKNGRFACMVCYHRPVFDTVATLAVHRSGKKHALEAETFMNKKLELEELKLKRKHEEYLKRGESVPTSSMPSASSTSGSHRLLNACVYDSRAKRRNEGPYSRRHILNVGQECEDSSTVPSSSASFKSRPYTDFSAFGDKPPQTIAEMRRQRKWQTHAENPIPVKPYVSKRQTVATPAGEVLDSSRTDDAVFDKAATDCSHRLNEIASSSQNKSRLKQSKAAADDATRVTAESGQQKEMITKYFAAVGSGWKRSRDGTWIKDAEAEFDSDDDVPPESL